jgi:D-amino peptidase
MRALILSDMEGVSGICKWDQVSAGTPLYEEGRRLYTQEVNAAVRGARAGGAEEVVVMDCHGAGGDSTFNSLIHEDLEADCEYVIQSEWTEDASALEEGCDAAILVGMHARAGSPGAVLSHTVSTTDWANLFFNGELVGETGINAAWCGAYGCPVAFVSGDDVTCAEASDLLGPKLATVPVKRGLGRYSARMVAPARARRMIEEGVAESLSSRAWPEPYDPGRPCEIRVEHTNPRLPDVYARRPGVELADPRTVVARGEDWLSAWRLLGFDPE